MIISIDQLIEIQLKLIEDQMTKPDLGEYTQAYLKGNLDAIKRLKQSIEESKTDE